jgi:aspartyl-tRNA(Asn)/glutamyl-tRNA(Gln) amidotransferase subunit A
MSAHEVAWMPATELAELIRTKRLSPVEVTRAVLDRIERLNPAVNAFCALTTHRAMEAARAAEQAVMRGDRLGPLHGLPVSIKDLAMLAGAPFMAGSRIFADRVAETDPPFVRRLRAAGAIVVGKTTTPEFGWKALGDSPLTGVTRNPWNPATTSGGSSAGAAAAAAAGLGPLHHGSDGAGSIRIPAAFCGVFGLKPSYGRVPHWPVSNADYTTHHGPITRTVADAALMLSVLAGPDDWDRTSLEGAPADYPGRLRDGIRGWRVAYAPTWGGLRVDPEIAALVRAALPAFEEQGARVEELDTPIPESRHLILGMWSAHEAGIYGAHLAGWREQMDPGLVACIEAGLRVSMVEYIRLRGEKLAYWDALRPIWERYDLVLTPTVSVPALEVGRLNPPDWPQHAWDWFPWAGFSYPFNFTGQPAATVPCGFTGAGLPAGLQIVGRRFADLAVLQAAAAFEAARPWASRRPALAA